MPSRLRKLIAWFGAVIGLAILAVGLYLPDTTLWRLHLLTGLWLLSLLPRVYLDRHTPVFARSVVRLALVFGLGFTAVALQLTRAQISQATAIRERAAALLQPTPQHVDEPTGIRTGDRTALGNTDVWPVELNPARRGDIVDRNDVVLATDQGGRRVYPNPDLGHITGFASRLYGASGVEASFDTYLSGAQVLSPTAVLEARLLGTPLAPAPPTTIQLTLDSTLQQAAQAALGERAGAVVLLDPQTGAILALATYPRFDPNQLVLPQQASDADVASVRAAWEGLNSRADSPLLNRATQGRYPPGSIIKTLTAAAALDSGVLRGPESQVTCPNRLPTEAGAPPVRNAVEQLSRRTGDPSDLRRVYAWSCNTAFAQIGLALGPERLSEYAARFGLGYADTPGTPDLRDIPADRGTIASTAAFLQRQAALADTAFGQGQAQVTPLDMAQMVAVIANDGVLMRPYLVQQARAGERVLYQAAPEPLRTVISPQAAQQVRSIMQTSVEIGYARPVALPGVTIGAKTGTAEAPGGAPHAWFVALAPVEQPRFAIAVVVEHGGEGSGAALPVARQVLAAALGVQQ